MSQYQVTDNARIPAPPEVVYRVLADYRQHHPNIVPREYFRRLEVESGGIGAGTRTRLEMRALGITKEARHVISEPEPGRILVEADVDGSTRTSFKVEPENSGQATRLTITTQLKKRPGLAGALERLATVMVLRRIYRKELRLIAAYVSDPAIPHT